MREAARRTHCLSNLKQLDMALGAHCYPPVTNYPDTLSGLNPNDVMPELFLCPCDPDSTLAPSLLAMTDSNCSYRYQPSNWPGTPAGVDLVFDKSIKYHGDGYNVLRTDHSVWWVAATSVPPIGTTVGH
jgi:hypothetical protein